MKAALGKSTQSEVLVALTHFVRGAARFSFATRPRQKARPSVESIDETRRRADLLQELYRIYSVEISGEPGVSVYRDTLPPDGWINDQLDSRNESWRVQNIDGFRCEIFDRP